MEVLELITQLQTQRDESIEKMNGITTRAAEAKRAKFTDDEQRDYDAAKADVEALQGRIDDLTTQEARAAAAADDAKRKGETRVRVKREPMTYRRNGQTSFFLDVIRAQRNGDFQAVERLQRHAKEQSDEVERRKEAYEDYEDEMLARRFEFERDGRHERDDARAWMAEVERRDISRVDGSGGEFVPPLWLIDEFVALARAARVTADLFNQRPLPPGTDSINIPRITGGTATGVQTADNAAVTEVDMTTGSVVAPVRTIAGQQDVALQLLEQSPVNFDEIVFSDLIADYNAQLDVQVINGSGAAGQILGILALAGTNDIAYTDATPTVPELYPKLANAVNQSATSRKLPPTAIVMHPRRWYWMLAALGSDNRPLVPIQGAPFPTPLAQGQSINFEGPVGVVLGTPVYVDPNIPVNFGAGTNEDRILVVRAPDLWLWESVLRTRTLPEVGSGTLTVRLQVYNYVAATAGRYPGATSFVEGTGLITPTF